jgi:hypothetical protein
MRTINMKIQTPQILKFSEFRSASMRVATIAAYTLAMAACAAEPRPPTEALQAADQAISSADKARVADSSSPELSEAREKITAAHAAVEKKQMVAGQRLAEQSRVDAELALARIEANKAKTVNAEMMKSNSSLNQEMQRNTGGTQ